MWAKNKILNDYSLQRLTKNIILAAQFFAILPVYGITSKHSSNLVFKWKSFKTIYGVFIIILQTIYTFVVSTSSNLDLTNFFSFVVIIWNVRGLMGLVIFLKVGYKWPHLLQQWTEVENSMLSYGPTPSLKLRFKMLPLLFTVTGIFEHSMFLLGAMRKVLSLMKNGDNFAEVFFKTLYGEFFNTVAYSHWKGVFIEFLALVTTFLWQFCNLMIILLSSALAERFRQINEKIIGHKMLNELQWRNIRMHYGKLSVLCKTFNEVAAEMILLSFFGNAYYVSHFFFQCYTPRSPFEVFYNWYNVIFNSTHFILVCYYAAWVQEESTKPMLKIFSVPTENMNYEIHRFLRQIVAEDVAVHGGGLFKITRSTVLKVTTSVIITLQLLFFQFKAQIPSNIS